MHVYTDLQQIINRFNRNYGLICGFVVFGGGGGGAGGGDVFGCGYVVLIEPSISARLTHGNGSDLWDPIISIWRAVIARPKCG